MQTLCAVIPAPGVAGDKSNLSAAVLEQMIKGLLNAERIVTAATGPGPSGVVKMTGNPDARRSRTYWDCSSVNSSGTMIKPSVFQGPTGTKFMFGPGTGQKLRFCGLLPVTLNPQPSSDYTLSHLLQS
jgi:hypothetical protein